MGRCTVSTFPTGKSVTPSYFLSRRPCQGRTPRYGQWRWLKVVPMEAVVHPAPGTHCPGTSGKPREAGGVEVVLWATGASWILQRGPSSALQVMGKGPASLPHQHGCQNTFRVLCPGVGLDKTSGAIDQLRRAHSELVSSGSTAPPAGSTLVAAGGWRSFKGLTSGFRLPLLSGGLLETRPDAHRELE